MSEQDEEKQAKALWDQYEPIYNAQGIDIKIIKPDYTSNFIMLEIPNLVEEIAYETDEHGNYVAEKDEYGKIVKNNRGEIIYKVKGMQVVQRGTKIIKKEIPVPNIATINRNTSNLAWYDIAFSELNDMHDALLGTIQERFKGDIDMSRVLYRHHTYRISVETLAKAKNQTTVQAIKTFITKSEGKKTIETLEQSHISNKPLQKGENLLDAARREASGIGK